MKLKDRRSAARRFTNTQIAGIALSSAAVIGLLCFGATQLINPTSLVRWQISGSVVDRTGGVTLTDAQVTKLTDQLVGESLEFFSTDVMTDFIGKAVEATLDEDTIKDAVLSVVETSGIELSDSQKDAVAKQVSQNVEASWLSIQADTGGFSDGQVAYLTQLISENIANELSNYIITTNDGYELSSNDAMDSIVTEVLERLFPDNPDIAKEYGSGGKILTEDDLAEILGSLDSASLAQLQKQLKSGNGSNLEKAAGQIPGDSAWEKLGAIFQQMGENNKAATDTANTVAQEAAARQELASSLKDTLNTNVTNVNAAIDRLQAAMTSGDTANAASISAAKNELQASIDTLRTSLSGSMVTLSADTRSSISTMQAEVTALGQAVAGNGSDLETVKSQLNTQISHVNTSLSNEIAETMALIKSGQADELEQAAEDLGGHTIFAKIGTLFKKVIQLGDTLGGQIAAEVADRKFATQTLQSDINSKVSVVSGSMITLKSALEKADADAVAAAKTDLGNALDELNAALAGVEESAGDNVDAKISSVKDSAAALKNALDTAGDNVDALETALSDAQATLGRQIVDLNGVLDNRMATEEQTRAASDAAVQAQIRSKENTTLEHNADSVKGTTVFAKIGSLYNSVTAIEASEEWAQNITLSAGSKDGERIYAIQDSTDPAHSGWKMWELDGESLGLSIRAATAATPESEIFITYAGSPVLIREYDDPVVDGVIHIYTPSVPEADIIIRTIHVENKLR